MAVISFGDLHIIVATSISINEKILDNEFQVSPTQLNQHSQEEIWGIRKSCYNEGGN